MKEFCFFSSQNISTSLFQHTKCHECARKNCHLRTKLTFSFYLVAIMGETTPAIISNESHWVPLGVTGCINGLDCLFFCIFFSSSFSSSPDLYWGDDVFCTWRWIFLLTLLQTFFFLSVMWTVSHRGRWALLEGFHVFDGPSLHLILDQKVRFTLISNARRCAMKGSFFFLLMKFFTVCFISTFYLKKKKIMQPRISSLCVCKGHLHFFHFVCSVYVLVTWGNWTCWVGEEWVDSFFSCKRKTHEFWENPRLLWLPTISKSQVCYWC